LSGAAQGVVAGQRFQLEDADPNPAYAGLVTTASFSLATDTSVRVRAGALAGTGGWFNVALFLGTGTPSSPNMGDNFILFHPGYAGGALRVEGPGAFGNTDVGFTPAIGAGNLYTLEVLYLGSETFQVTLTDDSNPLHTFSKTWSNSALVPQPYRVAVASNDAFGDAVTVFDDIRIGNAQATATPEPASVGLLAAALAGLAARRRRDAAVAA
jgi:hypothetical protein